MVYSFSYRRPAHVEPSKSIGTWSDQNSTHRSTEPSTPGASHGVPDALSFDKIIEGGTCPPCTARDFMSYLKYVEHAAENLQFLLWYKDYCRRFDQLDDAQKALAPIWTTAQSDAVIAAAQSVATSQSKNCEVVSILNGSVFAPSTKNSSSESAGNPSATPPRSVTSDSRSDPGSAGSLAAWAAGTVGANLESTRSYSKTAAGAFENADLNWQPFTIQPFREEIARIIATYIAEGAPRELNISARERIAVLHALRNTTHPSAFGNIVKSAEESLRYQSHPNFIRWNICNANPARVVFARCLGVTAVACGFVAALLITLSRASRGWRVLAAVGWMIGSATLVAAWKGMCIVLHGMHRRHLRPWELFVEDEERPQHELKKDSFDSISTGNSYEDEPWIARYDKRNLIRKVFDRETWIQEPALRQIQNTIFIQAIVYSFVITAILTGIFVALPHVSMF